MRAEQEIQSLVQEQKELNKKLLVLENTKKVDKTKSHALTSDIMVPDLRDESLSERLPENIFNRIHSDIAKASKKNRPSIIAFNLCHFIADELDKSK